jgi:hypothetical protein
MRTIVLAAAALTAHDLKCRQKMCLYEIIVDLDWAR